ncbi:hypothetical protein [Luteimonas vadosa]|uniref:Uncharacterized protein n=1 Tax=Luteimonas vadosa TaxID=1165507 RepID=A0ABP9E4D4_9GAMM
MTKSNRTMTRLMLVACLTLPFAACKKEEVAAPVAKAPMSAPAGDDPAEWRTYVSDVVTRNMEGIQNQPYVYLLPAESTEEFDGLYERMLDKAKTDVARGIIRGNMLAYASPSSGKMADIVVESFSGVTPDTMDGVRVLFIGDAADNARVQAAVEPAGVEYKFIEAK